jgi:hypothetical protein
LRDRESFAEAFAAGGLAVLLCDHRNLGNGEPRYEIPLALRDTLPDGAMSGVDPRSLRWTRCLGQTP